MHSRMRLLALVALLSILLPRVATADPAKDADDELYTCHKGTGTVAVAFKPDTEVKDLITWAMGFTCKSFMLDTPRVAGRKVTLIVPNRMSQLEAYNLFVAALQTAGLAVVPRAGVMRVIEAQSAKTQPLQIYNRAVPDGEQVVRFVYKPVYVQGETLHQAFMGLRSDAGDVMVLGSLLLVTDYTSNVKQMVDLAHIIDVPGGSDGIYTIPLLNGDATKIAEMVNQLLTLPAQGGAPPKPGEPAAASSSIPSKVLVDVRTNTLIIAGSEAAFLRIKSFVDRIAIPIEIEGGAAINVYPLSGAVAKELAATLTSAIGDAGSRTQQRPPGAPPAPPSPADALGASLTGNVRIIADEATNALIVTSSGRDYLAIRDVIRQLDQPRRQVFIEAVVLEVSLQDGLDIGTAGHAGYDLGNGSALVTGFEPFTPDKGLNSLSAQTLAGSTGLLAGIVGQALGSTALGASIPSYAALFQALGTQKNAKVISSPSLVAVDNADAKFNITQKIPYHKGVVLPATNTGFATSQNDFVELPLTLNIKPHISANDMVMLEVTHMSNDLEALDKDLGPTYTKRELETRVVVRDQQTAVISGLIQERETSTTSKVPLLGDIPLIGYFFKYSSKTKQRSNLLILLTPYVIKDQFDLELLQQRKQREAQEFAHSINSLRTMEYTAAIDYRKKRGLVEEINRAVQSVEEDAAARAAIGKPHGVQPGLIEVKP